MNIKINNFHCNKYVNDYKNAKNIINLILENFIRGEIYMNKEKLQILNEKLDKVIEKLSLMEQLPKDIEKGSLHKVLGYSEDFNLQEQSEDEMIRRQKEQINSGKVTYKELIGKLNWQKTMNKTNNPEFSRKLDRIMDELKDWWEKKKD